MSAVVAWVSVSDLELTGKVAYIYLVSGNIKWRFINRY